MLTQEQVNIASHSVCIPLVLVLNFALFQYLFTMFYHRMGEMRVQLLIATAAVSFLTIIPFSYPDADLIEDLNDISEVCSVLTFMLQIGILTRDIKKKICVKSLQLLATLGDVLVLFAIVVLLCNVIELITPVFDPSVSKMLDEIVENASLVYIFAFRFYFLAMARGLRSVLAKQKTEIAVYLLFITHEYPFVIMQHSTGLSWESFQGLWMRLTIAMCLWMTIKTKFTLGSAESKATRAGISFGRASQSRGPVEMNLPKTKRSNNQVAIMPMSILPKKR